MTSSAGDAHAGRPAPPGSPASGTTRRGAGGLFTVETDRVALGTHHGHELHARVERRELHFRAGRQWHLSLGLGRTRPVAIEVAAPGARYDLPIVTTDPWMRLARRVCTLAIAAVAVLAVRRARRKE